jgi:hypothetical protein
MLLPNGARAVVDIRKLRDYCLNPNNPRGKHKARIFVAALGLTVADAANLRHTLLEVARTEQAQQGELDLYGQRYTIDFEMETKAGKATIRSCSDHITGKTNTAADNLLCDEEDTKMKKRKPKLLDTVALLQDIPSRKLKRGEVGTVVEILAPDVYEVEFCDDEGKTYAELALRGVQIIPLHNQGDPLRVVA